MIVARAPNHLGDGVMALPALVALAARGAVIQAPEWLRPLYRHLGTVLPIGRARADTTVIFPPSLHAAWIARDAHRRIGVQRGVSVRIPKHTHRRQTYATLANAAGAEVRGLPVYPERGRCADVPDGHIGINPLTNGGPPRSWTGFKRLARGRQVVVYGAPGQERQLAPYADLGPVVTLDLPDLAATLQRCSLFVSNDTGPAHFARAVGVRTEVVYLSTAPENTGPPGASALFPGRRPDCAPCYRRGCDRGLLCR